MNGATAKVCAAFVLAASFVPQSAHALPISAFEIIADVSGSNTDSVQDLRRTREALPGVPLTIENLDATIIADNLVDADFGKNNTNVVTYAHRVDWLVPPASSFVSAILTITAYNARGTNDLVYFDAVNVLGNLIGNNNGISVTPFPGGGTLLASLLDGVLNISIDKQPTNDNVNNRITILESRLDITYEPRDGSTTVPEPATLLLFGGALAASSYRLRRWRRSA